MDLERIFDEVSSQMRSEFTKAQSALSHSGLKGQANEDAVRDLLRQYLPKTLDIASGTLVDSNGVQSRQLDIIVSDSAKTPIFFQAGAARVIPVECAYAVIEIKAYLDKTELERAFQNMKSVRSLPKTAFFKPKGAIVHSNSLYGKEWEYWPIHYFIFAYDSPSLESVQANLVQLQADAEPDQKIDSICVLDKGVIVNRGQDGLLSALPTPGSSSVASATTKPLLLFYALISVILNQAHMNSFNLSPYLAKMKF
jgi:hypothetical protein